MRIGIDIMGGDYAPDTTISGAMLAREELEPEVQLVLIGNEDSIRAVAKEKGKSLEGFEIMHTTEVILMSDSPTKALSKKPDSSISKGFGMLKHKEIDGLASTGNSGAMLVGAVYSGGTIPGVIRPCITTALPKENGSFNIILDVGVNADCRPDVMYQFAILGSLYAKNIYGIQNPRVGLLNIGEEEEKGNLLTQSTFRLMKDSIDFNFAGNIEGRDILDNKIDVIVCDGFTGNVLLKTVEAFYSLFERRKINDEYLRLFNYENYGGTPVLGVNSTVVIGHGASNDIAVKNMILLTKSIIEAKLSEKIREAFSYYGKD